MRLQVDARMLGEQAPGERHLRARRGRREARRDRAYI
jgi:hypothetical protein